MDAALNRTFHPSTRRPRGRIFARMANASFRRGTAATTIERYAAALAMVAICTLIGLWVAPRWGTAPVDMIFLPAVLAAAALWGLGPALATGATAALSYNFFFTEPVHTFRMNRATDVVTVIVLLIVALVTSRLAAGIRRQARIAASHAERNATIAGFARRLLSSSTEQEIAQTACTELNALFDCNAMLVSGAPEPRIVAAVPEGNRLTPQFIAMNGRDKWETLVLSGLIGTDEPWIEAMRDTLRQEADTIEALLSRVDKLEERLTNCFNIACDYTICERDARSEIANQVRIALNRSAS